MWSGWTEGVTRLVRIGLWVSLFWCPVAVLVILLRPVTFENFNHRLYDLKSALSVRVRPPLLSSRIIHLDVDDEALRTVGPWPWDRAKSAAIIDRLKKYGAALVVFDLIYSGKRSEEGDRAFLRSVAASDNTILAVAFGIGWAKDVPESQKVYSDKFRAVYSRAWKIEGAADFPLPRAMDIRGTLMPLPSLTRDCKGIGHITATPDSDGVHRRTPPLVKLRDRVIPSLALAAVSALWNLTPGDIRIDERGDLEIKHGDSTVTIPLDAQGMMGVNWAWPLKRFPHYSLADLLSDKPDPYSPMLYKDKIVIIGQTGSGMTDFGASPLAFRTPLSRLHSYSINTILTASPIVRIEAFPMVTGCAVTVTVIFLWVAVSMPLRRCMLAAAAICVVSAAAVMAMFLWARMDIGLAEPLFVFLPPVVLLLSLKSIAAELEAVKASWTMRRYLSEEVIKQVLADPSRAELPAERKELTILFVDIEGSTQVAETAEVEYVKDFFNEFYESMADAVFACGGTVDKFLGDGLMAFFGDPLSLENHALSAVKCALDMQKRMSTISEKWVRSGIREFRKGLRIRVGVNTGLVLVGNVGSERRMEYTVMGAAVNLASRLESSAPAGGIFISARTRALAGNEISCEGPIWIKAKGIAGELEVYLVTGPGALQDGSPADNSQNRGKA